MRRQLHSNPPCGQQLLDCGNNKWMSDRILMLDGDVKKLVAKLMCVNTDHIQIDLVDIRPQTNRSDCGLYVIANAFELCAKCDSVTCNWMEKCMRPHLLKCLENEAITHETEAMQQG